MLQNLAHAGEIHDATITSTSWFSLNNWYIALPFFILALAIIGYVTYVLSKKSFGNVFIVINVLLLVSGMYLYTKSPVLSIFALTAGFTMCLLSVLTMLAAPVRQ